MTYRCNLIRILWQSSAPIRNVKAFKFFSLVQLEWLKQQCNLRSPGANIRRRRIVFAWNSTGLAGFTAWSLAPTYNPEPWISQAARHRQQRIISPPPKLTMNLLWWYSQWMQTISYSAFQTPFNLCTVTCDLCFKRYFFIFIHQMCALYARKPEAADWMPIPYKITFVHLQNTQSVE